MDLKEKGKYRAAVYLRLSHGVREAVPDGDGSDSIRNQKAYIMDFLRTKPDIEAVRFFADDGYSGVDFQRPGFRQMMEAIWRGDVNCVVVKDLSRFGRNYIDTGEYLERVFPLLGVRFISVNDSYDSLSGVPGVSQILIPFKNLINDAYCRDISVKIRSHLEIKRKNGEFTGAFPVYGYVRDAHDRNRLAADPYASGIVREIFAQKLRGKSAQKIAEGLNRLGVLPPAEYKRSAGSRYRAPFLTHGRSGWTAAAVLRILRNEVYTGVLLQGKETTPNYKIKSRVRKPPEEWIRVENAHEAVVPAADFQAVRESLEKDVRIPAGSESAPVYAGSVVCSDCGRSMVRKTVVSRGRHYVYYVCSQNRRDKRRCSSHRIREEKLREAVNAALHVHVRNLCGVRGQDTQPFRAQQACGDRPGYRETQALLLRQIQKYEDLSAGLYEDMGEGVLDCGEYQELRGIFLEKVLDAKEKLENLRRRGTAGPGGDEAGMKEGDLMPEGGFRTDERLLAAHLVQKIYVYEDHRLEVVFRYRDGYEETLGEERRRFLPGLGIERN